MLKTLRKRLERKFGYQGYDLEDEARPNIQIVQPYTMLTYPRLVTLYEQAVFCEMNQIAGSFVECGTWKGGAVGLMALANIKRGSYRRHLHLFDSFEGIPEPGEYVDGPKAVKEVRSVGGQAKGRLAAVEGFYEKYASGAGTIEVNKRLLETIIGYDPSFIHYHKGWFQDTLPEAAGQIGDIAILRLDADWYDSTKVCLEHLYNNVVNGGFIIIDDYGYYEGCKKAVDEFIKAKKMRVYLNHVDRSCRYWVKQK